MSICLTFAEQIQAHKCAIDRVEAIGKIDTRHRWNNTITWHKRIAEVAESICGEMAVAKYFGIKDFVPTVNGFKDIADVGSRIEVKWTAWPEGSLIVHEYDRAEDIAVLVTGTSPWFEVRGWIPVSVARKDKYRHHSQPNWWVSQKNLQPIETLRSSNYGAAIHNHVQG